MTNVLSTAPLLARSPAPMNPRELDELLEVESVLDAAAEHHEQDGDLLPRGGRVHHLREQADDLAAGSGEGVLVLHVGANEVLDDSQLLVDSPGHRSEAYHEVVS